MAGERGILKALCVFCGANTGADPAFVAAAQRLGTLLAQRHITLVFGGGRVGLMGAVSGAAFAAGGRVIGIIPTALQKKELAYDNVDLSELRVVSSMHERKAMMAELADGFVALPGGFGTFEEFCEMVTWSQLGIHRKPCGLVNVNGYYDGLLALFDHAVGQGLIKPTHRSLVVAERDPEQLLAAVAAWEPPKLEFRLDWKAS